MMSRSSSVFLVVLGSIAIALGMLAAAQWCEGLELRAALLERRERASEHERLRAENARLRARQIPAAELEALRADHAALPRLRAELEALRPRP